MTEDSPWLDDDQQRLWRRWVALSSELPAALHRQLQADSGLSLQDFEVLVRLTEVPDGRARVTDLAHAVGWERSRLSHHIKRMQGRGLVTREECCDDGRGAFIALTPAGRDALERAAPGHARTVRDLVFASLGDAELRTVSSFLGGVLDRLGTAQRPTTGSSSMPQPFADQGGRR
jgi:DNA-binding MarR family transcriptional regulator